MIRSFRCRETGPLFADKPALNFQIFERVARRKLFYLHAAKKLEDLRVPPGNRLEGFRGNREGRHSIRINDQWRICFIWRENDAHNVEIVDYH